MLLSKIFMLALLFCSLILILIILVQKGKGGGLAGALGGMGGQSAFGAKAGDTFTRITIGVAFVWILLCLGAVALLKPAKGRLERAAENRPVSSIPAATDMVPPATKDSGTKENAGTLKTEEAPAEKPAEKKPAE